MMDPIPSLDNRFAVAVGRIVHPYLLSVPATLAVLSGLPLNEALGWTLLILVLLIVPGITYAAYLQRQGRPLYRRESRSPLYLFGWVCVLICLGIVIALHAPLPLIASVGSLAVWIPLQGTVNAFVTKVSGHAAVAAGCFTALFILGKIQSPIIQVSLIALIILTLWARVVTRNHTVPQLILGVLVGALPVLLVFPLVLA